MTPSLFPPARGLAILAGLFVAGCSGLGETGSSAAPAAARAAPPVDMAGRWRLVSASGRACGMTFVASAPAEGSIAPEGGCPANFFTSRRWVLQQGSLLIQDHTQKPLAVLKQNAPGRFEGELANREAIWLER
ncbi:MAG TPA: AprI/Inh family metalloprotease inhibitor [Xanthobacteraceae bacterium]|nr:AprI/Inh family metalloprotease inhibitor [Xanthobacteraceae bacterium]